MAIKAVIFDMDGTLLDTLADIAAVVNRVLAAQDFPTHTLEDYKQFIGSGARKLMERALPADQRTPIQIDRGLAAIMDDYRQNCVVESCLYPGIADMLDLLQATGTKLAVLSNKPHSLTQQCAETLLWSWNFELVWGHQDHIPEKPDPAGAIAIAEQLGVEPADCLFVGDSGIDIKTGLSAGMCPVGVSWGFRPTEELQASGAKHIVSHPSEIIALVKAQ